MSLTVAILGRPNVGKSTLFNRLVGRRHAIVDDLPGVTRDRIAGDAVLGGLRFQVIDTAGLDDGPKESLAGRLRRQSEAALAEADLGLFLIDARAGLTPIDREVATWLRRQGRPILLVANKCEGGAAFAFASEAHALGLGDPIPISAQQGEGLADLFEALLPYVQADESEGEPGPDGAPADGAVGEEPADRPLRLAVVGRPNVGKSSLVNRLIAQERLLTGPEPGLTRDAVRIAWSWRGRLIELVDTAGLRRKARVEERLEKLSTQATIEAIRRAHAVLLLLDATQPLERQDLSIAALAAEEGRALVIGLNKWDLVEAPQAALAAFRADAERRLPQVDGVALVPVSALAGHGLDRLLQAVVTAEERWSRRLATGPLNRWLEGMVEAHPPPLVDGRRLKLRYATQVKARPPTFVLFANQPGELHESYLRYLARGLRRAFDLDGTPLRFRVRKSSRNPYDPG